MFSTISKTSQKLADMFTENTGAHFLDSGSAYGRNWERNQGKTVADFLNAPNATWSKDYGASLDLFNFLNERLTFNTVSEALTAEMLEALGDEKYNCWEMESWAIELTGENCKVWNSYNWDNLLNGTIQGVDFKLANGNTYVILQVHGGCDVRGGYTAPVIFEALSEYWIHDCDSVTLTCTNCETDLEIRGADTYNNATDEWISRFDSYSGCPDCGADFKAIAPEASAIW